MSWKTNVSWCARFKTTKNHTVRDIGPCAPTYLAGFLPVPVSPGLTPNVPHWSSSTMARVTRIDAVPGAIDAVFNVFGLRRWAKLPGLSELQRDPLASVLFAPPLSLERSQIANQFTIWRFAGKPMRMTASSLSRAQILSIIRPRVVRSFVCLCISTKWRVWFCARLRQVSPRVRAGGTTPGRPAPSPRYVARSSQLIVSLSSTPTAAATPSGVVAGDSSSEERRPGPM